MTATMPKTIETIALERRVTALFSRYLQPGSPGAVVGVMRGSTIELCKGFGMASLELGVPILGFDFLKDQRKTFQAVEWAAV